MANDKEQFERWNEMMFHYENIIAFEKFKYGFSLGIMPPACVNWICFPICSSARPNLHKNTFAGIVDEQMLYVKIFFRRAEIVGDVVSVSLTNASGRIRHLVRFKRS